MLAKLDETVQNLESKKSSSQVEKYQAKVECLETQLESLRSAQAQEKEKVKKLSEELRVVSLVLKFVCTYHVLKHYLSYTLVRRGSVNPLGQFL